MTNPKSEKKAAPKPSKKITAKKQSVSKSATKKAPEKAASTAKSSTATTVKVKTQPSAKKSSSAKSKSAPTTKVKKSSRPKSKTNRVAIVMGLRTPFAKQLTAFKTQTPLDLGKMVVTELIQRSGLDAKQIQQLVFGKVLPMTQAPNIAREIVLGTNMNVHTDAFSVTRACATSYQSAACIADSIRLGRINIGIAGGADSSSVVPIGVSGKLSSILVDLSKARSMSDKLKLLSKIRPADLVPVAPAVKEYSTGLTMGDNAEQMARDYGITRSEQDDLAHRSHQLAAKAWKQGFLDDQVMTAFVAPYKEAFDCDNNIRFNSERQAYNKLKPAFDRQYGTVTAANSTPLTDGAAAMMLMSEDTAKALGYNPLGYIKSYAFAAIGAEKDMLMGPSFVTPMVLDELKMTLNDIDLIDMHEAFAAQTLCNIKAFASKQFAQDKLNRSNAIGEIDMDKFNVLGGSLAYGHPFAATGSRQIVQLLTELKRRGGGIGLATACAAGGLAGAMIVEAE